jgi:hypothetical protein
MNRWPDPSCAQSLSALEEMSRGTKPLANFATVRSLARAQVRVSSLAGNPATPGANAPNGGTNKGLDPEHPALFVEAAGRNEIRVLSARAYRELIPGLEYTGFAILLRDDTWLEPMRAYLESGRVAKWLEHHAERRGDRWHLSESLMKMIPVPDRLADAISREGGGLDLREFVQSLAKNPESIRSSTLPPESRYVAAAMALRELDVHAEKLRPFLSRTETGESRIEWSKLLGLLRASDSLPMTQHPFVRIVGSISPNIPLTKIDRLKAPQNGLLLMTEAGGLQKVVFDHRMLAEMAWDQTKFHTHPTWGELVAAVRLPRSLEIAESAAHEILTSHEAIERKANVLRAWLSEGLSSAE